jgi:tryptophanyl-tRNA synthetase
VTEQGPITKRRLFSGIQPTGNIHIGNYLGAIRQWTKLQAEYEGFFCVVDLHAITVPQPPGLLKKRTREVAGLLVAAGINPERSTLFIQSRVSAHSELAWILNCFIPVGWMKRMTQFKDKSTKQKEEVTVGLFDYPALMTADILLYETDVVPVGNDQKQHVELARNVANRFNATAGVVFKVPEPLIPQAGARIMSLDDPARKMSKSEDRPNSAILLLDSPDAIRSKIMKATTDSRREIRFDKSRHALYNLLTMYELFSGFTREQIESRFAGRGYGELKKELAEVVVTGLAPLQRRYEELADDPSVLERLLDQGEHQARTVAEKTLDRVKERLGLG